ncbi:hypothetical protein BGZ54_000691 [Gamsiella multidivaricata]|nr:hypothetical protein BGZ54_000691 [Gamsiella multidivaricata]
MHTLAITSKRLRCIAMDGPLRRHILLKRTPARLQSSLADRPSRDTLAKQNILRGIHIRQHIQEGNYIGGPTAVRSYHISCRLERQMVSIKIAKKLKTRPDWTELVERGLIPEEMFVNEEEFEAKRRWRTYRHQQQQQQRQQHKPKQTSFLKTVALEERQINSDSPLPEHSPQMQHNQLHPLDINQSHEPVTEASSSSSTTAPESDTSAYSGNRSRRQKKSISMVLVPKIELLRKSMDRDRLSRLVQKRPSPEELNRSPKTATVLNAYHLIAYSVTSPDLVPLTTQLSFLLKGERLSHWLYHRPSPAVMLNERHILKTEARTAWMVCPGVSKKVRFYEGLIQKRRDYEEQQQMLLMQHQLQPLQQQHLPQTAVA